MLRPDTIITIDLGDSHGKRNMPFSVVQQAIGQYLNAAKFSLAASVSIQLAEQRPEDLWPQLIAAESLYMQQQIESATRYIDRALKIDPRNIASLVVKSRLCLYSGQHKQAIRLIDTAIGLAPPNAKLQHEKGELLVDAGKIDGARDAFHKAIKLDPHNTGALLGLSRLPGDNFSEKLIKQVEALLQSPRLSDEDQVTAHFALAHACDKKSDIAGHFNHLDAGNTIKNQSLNFDPGASRLEAQRIIDFFSADFFRQYSNQHSNPANIIFIVGFPRCGSTLVEQILTSHPLVSGAGEIFALNHAIRGFQQSRNLVTDYPEWVASQPDNALALIADDYLRRVGQLNQTAYLTDKLLNNYVHAGLIHLIFPNARIIHVQRNPIDVCYSCYKRIFNLGSVPYTYNLDNLAGKYRDYRRVIRHWNTVLPGILHTIEYEQLIKNQEEVTRELVEFCGLPWNDACLRFHENIRTVQTNSNFQVRQPLYTDSIDRWKVYEQYLGPLMELTND